MVAQPCRTDGSISPRLFKKDLNTLVTENNIQPNLLRNWKREFLNNASAVFDDKRVKILGIIKISGTLRNQFTK